MPLITQHKPVGVLTNPHVARYECSIQDRPLFALKCWGIFVGTMVVVCFVIGGVLAFKGDVASNQTAGQRTSALAIPQAPAYRNGSVGAIGLTALPTKAIPQVLEDDEVTVIGRKYAPVIRCPDERPC